MEQNGEHTKEPFSALAAEMGWSVSTTSKVERYVQAAKEIRGLSYNEWAAKLGRPSTVGDYYHFHELMKDDKRLEGWVGGHYERFLACGLEH